MRFLIREFREKQGLTQRDLAKSMHKAIGTIQSWENGTSYPNAEALCDLCSLLDTDPNTILGWYEDHPRTAGKEMSNDENELLINYRSCTPEWKRTISMNAIAAKGESLKNTETYSHRTSELEKMAI